MGVHTKLPMGTVVRYTPDESRHNPRWCREGMAIADERGRLVDTYWCTSGDQHVLNEVEVESVEVLFSLDDYRELDRRHERTWQEYRPEDRQVVTSQHGLRRRLFVREGAEPDHDTKVSNAREAVAEAEREVASARGRLRSAQWDLDLLLAKEGSK